MPGVGLEVGGISEAPIAPANPHQPLGRRPIPLMVGDHDGRFHAIKRLFQDMLDPADTDDHERPAGKW